MTEKIERELNRRITRRYMESYRKSRRPVFQHVYRPCTSPKEIFQSFGSKIESVAMNRRFIIVGLKNGSVDCIYRHGRSRKWSCKISEHPITALLIKTWDILRSSYLFFQPSKPISAQVLICVGDLAGNFFLVSQKGEVMAKVTLNGGQIFSLASKSLDEVVAYHEGGSFVVRLQGERLAKNRTKLSHYSMDHDGVFYSSREMGDIPLEKYWMHCPAKVLGTPRIQLEWNDDRTFVYGSAFSIVSDMYKKLIENTTAPTTLEVVNGLNERIRELDFGSPVRQIINCFVEEEQDRQGFMYVLLWNDDIIRYCVEEVMDPQIDNHELDQMRVYGGNSRGRESQMEGEEAEIVDISGSDGDIMGISVLAGEIVFYTGTEEDNLFLVRDESW